MFFSLYKARGLRKGLIIQMAEWLARGLWHYASKHAPKRVKASDDELTAGLDDFASKVRVWTPFLFPNTDRNTPIRWTYNLRPTRGGNLFLPDYRIRLSDARLPNVGPGFQGGYPYRPKLSKDWIPDFAAVKQRRKFVRSPGYFRPFYVKRYQKTIRFRPRYQKRRRWRRRY